MSTLQRLIAGALTVLTGAAVTVLVLGRAPTTAVPAAPNAAEVTAVAAAEQFLHTYTNPDGRVVRRDQGGDTVSEGQAYGMLLAVAAGDRARFTSIWDWTRATLLRPDGLLAWQWRDGALIDHESAADADLDAARALVLAGTRFTDPAITAQGTTMATAVLDHETVHTPLGPVLTAGTWATSAPWAVNPSYFSPLAAAQLGAATGDPRWAQVGATGTTITRRLLAENPLPPDWAQLSSSGAVTPTPAPDGTGPRFSFDAARMVLRTAESCSPEARALAANTATELDAPVSELRGVYALNGTPTVDWQDPLILAAAAAADTARGQQARAGAALDAAARLAQREPGYYGAAWVALGRVMLQTDLLGSCTTGTT